MNTKIIIEIENYVKDIFEKKLPDWAVYHNLDHTLDTVSGCKTISKGSNCSQPDIEILLIAAWFHDTGYLKGPNDHERISASIAEDYLKNIVYPTDKIELVIECILATRLGYTPKNLLQKILCDADLISLGQTKYEKLNNLLKLEFELREKKHIDDQAWLKRSFNFLAAHTFFTNYAKQHFNEQLNKNIKNLKEKLAQF